MANIRGRSKACGTCLRRRKGCDQQRPACGQCRKACIACEGYPDRHSLSFIHTTAKTIQKSNTIRQRRTSVNKPAVSSAGHIRAIASNDILAINSIEMGLIDTFWSRYLPNGREIPSDVAHNFTGGWIHVVQSLYRSKDSLLRSILLSLALATKGTSENLPSARELGLRLYNDALVEASTVFRCPKRAQSDSFLAVVRLFTLYESHYGAQFRHKGPASSSCGLPTQAENWLTHVKGDVSLLLARSPSSFIEGDAHRLFVDGRFHLIFSALVARKPTPIASAEWMTIPWTEHDKTPRDRLLDILANITCIISATDNLNLHFSEATHGVYGTWSDILSSCQSIEEELAAWEKEFAPEAIRLLPVRSSDLDARLSNATAPPITSHQLAATHLMTLYWASCLALNQVQQDLCNITTGGHVSLKQHFTDGWQYFQKLLTILPVLFEPAVGLYRMHVASAPTHIAVRHLRYLSDGVGRQEGQAILEKCLSAPSSRNLGVMMRSLFQNCPADAKLITLFQGLE